MVLEKPLNRKITPSEGEVISSASTLSGVSLWDLKREAYTKLLAYPELMPTSSPEETFFNSLSGTLIDSLAQVIKQVHNGLSLSTGDQTDLDTYRADMELDFEDLVALDGTLDYSDMDNLTSTWFLQRDTLLQSIALNAANEGGLESARDTQVNSDLLDALAYNTSISTSLTYGKARKTFTQLLLSHLLFLPMTESLYDDALSLAQDDVENTGMATEEGLRFLGPCDQGLYLQREQYGQEERPTTHTSQSIGNAFSLQASPNPTSGIFSMRLPEHSGGLLTVHDVHGQKLKALFVASSESNVSFDLSGFSNGIYWIAFSDEAGKVLSTVKVVVIH